MGKIICQKMCLSSEKNENNSITYQRDHKIDGGGGHIGHIGSIQNGIGFLWDIGLSQFYCGQF